MLLDQVDKLKWKEDLREYSKNKNRKLTFKKPENIQDHRKVKNSEFKFNTILNKYRDP